MTLSAWDKLENSFGTQFENVLPDKIWNFAVVLNYSQQFSKLVKDSERELELNFLLIPDKKLRAKYLLDRFNKVERQMEENLEYIKQLRASKPKEKIDKQVKQMRILLLQFQNNALFGFTLIKLNDLYSEILNREGKKVEINKVNFGRKTMRSTTIARYKMYLDEFKALAERKNIDIAKAEKMICTKFSISPRTFYRAIEAKN